MTNRKTKDEVAYEMQQEKVQFAKKLISEVSRTVKNGQIEVAMLVVLMEIKELIINYTWRKK